MRSKKTRSDKCKDEVGLIRTENDVFVGNISPVASCVETEDTSIKSVMFDRNSIVSVNSSCESVEAKAKRYKSDWNESSGIFRSGGFGEENVVDVSVDNTEDSNNLFIFDRNGDTGDVGVSFGNKDYVSLVSENVVAESNASDDSENSNRNVIDSVESSENFKQLSNRYLKFCLSSGTVPGTIVPLYSYGPNEEEADQTAKFVLFNEVRMLVNDFKSNKLLEIQKNQNEETVDEMTSRVVTASSVFDIMIKNLDRFVETLSECASLDFGFGIREENENKMCHCPCSVASKRFRQIFKIDSFVDCKPCKKKAMKPIEISSHLSAVGKLEGYSLTKAMHIISFKYLQNKYPEKYNQNGSFSSKIIN
jgi:hypothetical protein